MISGMFAVPYYKAKVSASSYDKDKIIANITQNYKKNPNRNNWSDNSSLHHSYNDENNSEYKKIDYRELSPLYDEHVKDFLSNYFQYKENITYRMYVTNYTCFSAGQHMQEHNHPKTSFSGIHYVKFIKGKHPPTIYHNSADWNHYIKSFYSNQMILSHYNVPEHAWLGETYALEIEEDDIVITPSILRHSVPRCEINELRIAVIFHIDIIEDNQKPNQILKIDTEKLYYE